MGAQLEVLNAPPRDGWKIESDIPIPMSRAGRPGGGSKYPWHILEIGQSFFVPGTKNNVTGIPVELKRRGYRITTRVVDGGCRVWRIA